MPDSGSIVGRGGIVLTITDPVNPALKTSLPLRYEIHADGIRFYNLSSSKDAVRLFDLVKKVAGTQAATVEGSGHLMLVALPASPRDAFYNLSLTYQSNQYTLRVVQAEPFALGANTFFQKLDLQFTESRSGTPFAVSGGVTAVLFGQKFSLLGALQNAALVFGYQKPSTASPLSIDSLGNLDLDKLEVSANYDRWAGLQALYTFDKGTDGTLYDTSGNALNLTIDNPALVQWVPGGISVPASTQDLDANPLIHSGEPATNLINACKASNEITVEAWIKPANLTQFGPARIVELSENNLIRNLTLGQGHIGRTDDGQPPEWGAPDFCVVRLRSDTREQGVPEVISIAGTLTTELTYLVLTHDSTGSTHVYINGVEVLAYRNDQALPSDPANAGSLDNVLDGSFSNWDENYELVLANALSKNRPWAGELHQIALYDRAIPAAEIGQNYSPLIHATGKLALTHVPAPLSSAISVDLVESTEATVLTQQADTLSVTPLQFSQVHLVWQKARNAPFSLSGHVLATLFGQALELAAALVDRNNRNNESFLVLSTSGDQEMSLNQLGTLTFSELALQANRSLLTPAWEIETNSQSRFTVMPAPLEGPFDTTLTIEQGRLWLTVNPADPLELVQYLTFERVNLGFAQNLTDWDTRGEVQVRLLGKPLLLSPLFAVEATKVFSLHQATAQTTTLMDTPATLDVSSFKLRSQQTPTGFVWQAQSISHFAVGTFAFSGSLVLDEGAAEGERRLFLTTSETPQTQFSLIAGAATPTLTVRSTIERIAIDHTGDDGSLDPADWVLTAQADLSFDRINQTLSATDFRVDRAGIGFTLDRQEAALTFALPSPTFNGQTAQLGQVVFDLSNFALMPGSTPTIDAHLTAHLPAQLDAVLGAARSRDRFFADAVDLKLEIRPAQGLLLNVLSAFVQPEWGEVSEDAGSRWLSLNLPNLVQARMQLPELHFVGRGFSATGQFEQVRSLHLPLALAKHLLKTYGLNAVADALPQTVPIQAFNVLSATDLDVDALLTWIEDHGKAEGAEFPRADFQETLSSLATRLAQLPDTFSPYLNTMPPKAGTYQLDITDDAGASLDLAADAPIQCLVLAAPPLLGLFGVTLRRVTIAQMLGGLLYAPRVDATVDYFDLLALETALAQSTDSPLPTARALKQQLTARDLVTIVNYQPSQPLAVPLFYRDLGFEFLGLEGLGFGMHGQFDRQPLTHPQFVNLIGALAHFLSDTAAVLSDDPFTTRNLPLQFGIDRAASQLPQYTAGSPPKLLGPSDETWTVTAQFRDALNALKRGRVGGLLRLLPLAKRSGAIVANFGPMQADSNWAVVSTQEFPATLLTSGLSKLALITADQRNGLSNLIQFAPNRARTVEDDTAIAFLVGNWTIDRRLDLKLCLGLAQSLSRGYGTGFSIAGLLAKDDEPDFIDLTAQGQIVVDPKSRQPVQLHGTSALRILNEPIFSGDIQLAGDRFFLNGQLSLFPRWSPLQVTSDTQIEITPEARVHSVNPVTATLPDFALLDPVVAIENGRITLSGLWLGQQATFIGIRRSNQFILQGDVPFALPFSLTLGPIFDPRTGVKIADKVSLCQGIDCRQIMNVTVQVELSAAGFLARINSTFTWEDKTFTVQNVVIPEFTIFAPTPTRNALLNLIIEQLKANANQIFADRFRNDFDYFFAKERPFIVYGKSATPVTIQTVLPVLFSADLTTPIVAGSNPEIVRLEKLPAGYTLTLNPPATTQKDIDDAYETFLTKLESQPNAPLIAGAANLIKARIAERLPMPIDRGLYYHYGFQSGQYLDLQAGMRLRVDQQAFQYVPDNTAENGFISSGTVYYQINSYLRTLLDGKTQVLLGFDPFLSRLQIAVGTNTLQFGASSTINLLQVGYRFPYYRLFYPSQFPNLAVGGGATGAERDRIALIVGAASLTDLKAATDQVLNNGRVSPSNTRVVSFFFRGRATVIPEISVFVQEQPVYVPVGTTLRQIIERYAAIPTGALPGQNLQFQQSKVRRLVHEGIDSAPTYKFINLDYQQYTNGMDVYDLPAVKGDRFYF